MFSCGLKEAQDGEVTFHDIQPEVLLAVINFIYTGKIKVSQAVGFPDTPFRFIYFPFPTSHINRFLIFYPESSQISHNLHIDYSERESPLTPFMSHIL